jgi:transglutaminase-like putative cysteine protease
MEMNKKPLKLVLYAAIILFWAGSIIYLFASHYRETTVSVPGNVQSNIAPVSEWMGLYMGDKKIGYDHEEIIPLQSGYVFKTRMFMRIMLMGQEKEITTISDTKTDSDYYLKSMDFSLKTSGMEIAATGKVNKDVLSLSLKGPGGTTKQEIHLKEPPISSDGIVMRIVKDGFGRSEYNFHTFDPTLQQELPVHVRIAGRETKSIMGSPVDTFKLEIEIKDMKETMWVTPQGETVEELSPLGFRSVLEPRTIALTKGWGGEPVDLIAATAIKSAGVTVTYPAGVTRMEAYVTGISNTESIPSSDFQRQEGNLITVFVPQKIGTYPLPYRHPSTMKGLSVEEELDSNALINTDNADIISKAKEIIHGETDARKAAELLNQWVYTHVRGTFTVALPRSIDLLKNPQGDCKAHTILFTALARAVGLPAKMAMGVVLMPDGYFYYHAWPLVYLNGWVPVDPTLGEFPADATHIMLASGSLNNWMDILGVVGRLQINIMQVN